MGNKHIFDADLSDEKLVEIADIDENTKYEPKPPRSSTTDFKSTAKRDVIKKQYASLTPELTSSVIQHGVNHEKSIEITDFRDDETYEPQPPSALTKKKSTANRDQIENQYAFLIPKLTSSVIQAGINDKKSVEIADVRENTKYEKKSPREPTSQLRFNVKENEIQNQYAFLVPELVLSMIQSGIGDENSIETADARKGTKFKTLSPSALTALFKIAARGSKLKNRYAFLIPKLASMMQRGFSKNPFQLISFLPYIILAVQKANAPLMNDQSGNRSYGFGNTNLANVLQDPENLKNLFLQGAHGELAIDSLKLLAGPRASAAVDKLMEEIKNGATDKRDGVTGIDGKHLMAVLQQSDALKKLFMTDKRTIEGLNFLNAYIDSYLSPELKNVKSEILVEMKNRENNRLNDNSKNQNFVKNAIQGSLSDSIAAFFKIGYKKINENLERLNSKAQKDVIAWKRIADDRSNGTAMSTSGQLKHVIIKKSPQSVLKTLAAGNELAKNQYQLLSSFAMFFLPLGLPVDILKFLCLMTYIMLMTRKENVSSKIDQTEVPNLNTDNIIDKLNNNNLMSTIFPSNDHSNVRINMLKFLAGPEANIMDALVGEIKKIKNEKGIDTLSVYDLLKNAEFFKNLYAMKEKSDANIKNYLGIDVGRFKKEIADEHNENPDVNTNASTSVTNASSATYRRSLRKVDEQMKNINGGIAEEAERMTRAPQNTLNILFHN